jgi:hypothetical protein
MDLTLFLLRKTFIDKLSSFLYSLIEIGPVLKPYFLGMDFNDLFCGKPKYPKDLPPS